MSMTRYEGTFSATIHPDDVPEGKTPDDVWDSLRAAVEKACAEWYAANPGALVGEPEVYAMYPH
ncbi:hypothetical protein [Nocardia sp. NPDC004722]